MKLTISFLLFIFIFILCPVNAQVTIGSGEEPENGALLDLKEYVPANPVADNTSANKGILFPRVRLTDHNNLFPMFEDDGNGGYKIGLTAYSKAEEDLSHIGLIVYNLDETIFSAGLHFWTGLEWRRIDGASPAHAQINGTLICTSEYTVPNRLVNGQPFDGIMKIPYTGGNGGAYPGTAPVSIGNGLWIERIGGVLALGAGEVAYHIFTQAGTPVSGLPASNTISFQLPQFLNIVAGCYVTIGEDVEVKAVQYVRKTVDYNESDIHINSEVQLGNLKVRVISHGGDSNISSDTWYPQIQVTQNTRLMFWANRTGGGTWRSAWDSYGQIPLIAANGWYDINQSNGSGGGMFANNYIQNEKSDRIMCTASHRDFLEFKIVLQNNNLRETYRILFSVYPDIAGTTQYPEPITGACTIFIEKLD